jgi:hypothetical protein
LVLSDSGEFVGMERGKVVAEESRLLVGSETVVVVPSPDMASEACREPVGKLSDGREDNIGVRDKGGVSETN